MSRVLIVNGSPRKNGVDSGIAAVISAEFSAKGHSVETVDICSLTIGGCRGCMSCRKTGRCVQDDDMQSVIDRMRASDMIVLMSPIYFAAETGQTKTFIDRLTSAFSGDRPMGKARVSSVLLTCADPKGGERYGAALDRLRDVMGYLKVDDHDGGCIIGGLTPETVRDSPAVREYIDGLASKL